MLFSVKEEQGNSAITYYCLYCYNLSIVVLLSVQAIDGDCNQTGQMIASLLDWPQVQCCIIDESAQICVSIVILL